MFSNNPVQFGEGDLYFYKSEEDGSYFIAILNLEKKRLYTMEFII